MTHDFDSKFDRYEKAIGCGVGAYILAGLAFWGVVIYVVAHFVLKAW